MENDPTKPEEQKTILPPHTTKQPELPKPEAKLETKPEPKPDAKPEPKPEAAAKKPAADVDDDDDAPTPDEKGFVTMPLKQFLKRAARMTKRELKKHFGTDDLEAIVKEREELVSLRAEKEETRRKELSEKQKLEEDLKTERAAKEAAMQRAEEAELRVQVRAEEQSLTKMASEHIADADVEDALDKFAAYCRRNPKEAAKMKQKDVNEWFADLAEKKPHWARTKPEEKAKVKVAVTNGTDSSKTKPPAGKSGDDDASASPFAKNKMSRKDMQAKFGVSY